MRVSALLELALSAAVPLWIEEFRHIPIETLLIQAREAGQVVAEKGDIIQFKSEKKGESAKAFNALARGLAIMAFVPGGVKFLGLHFEALHPDSEAPL